MITSNLLYHRPVTLQETSEILAEHHGSVAILGGGTQLLPRLTRNEVSVEHIVDLGGLNLTGIYASDGGGVQIGATVTYADILESPLVQANAPLMRRMARGVTGGRQLTQQATIAGALCFNYPSSDAPGVLTALDTVVGVYGVSGLREVPVREFLLGAFTVDLQPGEFVTSLTVSRADHFGYCKIKHSSGSWPIATASAVKDSSSDHVRVTVAAVQPLPVTLKVHPSEDVAAQVSDAITDPWSDVLAPAEYRVVVGGVAAVRALNEIGKGANR